MIHLDLVEVALLHRLLDLLEAEFSPAELARIARAFEDPAGFIRLNEEALFKNRFKWTKEKSGFWRVDQI